MMIALRVRKLGLALKLTRNCLRSGPKLAPRPELVRHGEIPLQSEL